MDLDFAFLETVRLDLLGDQVLARDRDLLVLGVTGEPDDLHTVQQRLRHAQRVGRRDEHHVRQVVVDFEIVVVERGVLLGIEHLEQGRRRVSAEIRAQLVDLIEQEQRIRGLRLLHALDDLARQRANVGPAMAADLRLVAHAAQRHANEVATCGLGDRLAERGLADAGRTDEAQDRALHLVDALLDREVLEDALLHLLEAVMIGVENLLGVLQVLDDLGRLAPRNRQQPVEVVAHHRRLGRHRAHRPQLLHFGVGLLPRLLAEAGLLDALLQLGDLVATVLGLAKLLLDRLHLFVEIVLALRLLHLTLHAIADLLLDLQDADLALHQAEYPLQALRHGVEFEQLLLLGDLERQMRGDRIGELRRFLDLVDRNDDFRRHLLVQFDVVLELRDHGAGSRLQFRAVAGGFLHVDRARFEEIGAIVIAGDLHAAAAFDQHLDGVVGQLQQLQHGAERADCVDVLRAGIVLAGILLGDQQNLLVVLHDLFQGLYALLTTNEERDDHAGKHDDVAQRQDGIDGSLNGGVHDASQRTLLELPVPRPWIPLGAIHGTRTRALAIRDWPEQRVVQAPSGRPPATVTADAAKLRPEQPPRLLCARHAHKAAGRDPRSLPG